MYKQARVQFSVTSSHLSSVSNIIVGLLQPLLDTWLYTGVQGSVVQCGSLVQQPLQQHRMAVNVANNHPLLVDLPELLFHPQLKLHPHIQTALLL